VIHINEEIIRRVLADASTKGFTLFKRNLYSILREKKTIFVVAVLLLPAIISLYWVVEVRFDEDEERVELTAHELGNDVDAEADFPTLLFTGADLRFPVRLMNEGDRKVPVYVNGTIQNQSFSGGPFVLDPHHTVTKEVLLPTGNFTAKTGSPVFLYLEIQGTEYTIEQLLRDIEESGFTYELVIERGGAARDILRYGDIIPPWLDVPADIDIYRLVELYNATELKQNSIASFKVDVFSDPATMGNELQIPSAEESISFEYENHSKEIVIQLPRIMTFDRDTTVKGWVADNSSSWDFQIKAYIMNPYFLVMESPVFNSSHNGVFHLLFPEEAFTDEYSEHELVIVYFFENANGSLVTDFGEGARYRTERSGIVALSSTLAIESDPLNLSFVRERDSVFTFRWPLVYVQGLPATLSVSSSFYIPHEDSDPYDITVMVENQTIYNDSLRSTGAPFLWSSQEFTVDDAPQGPMPMMELNISIFNGYLNEQRYFNSSISQNMSFIGMDDFYSVVWGKKHEVVATYGIDLAASLEFPSLISTKDDETIYLEVRNDGLEEHDIEFTVSIQSEDYELVSTVNASENRRIPLEISTRKLKGENNVLVRFFLTIRKVNEKGGRSTEESQEIFQGFGNFDLDELIGDDELESGSWEDDEFIYITESKEVQVVETKKDNQVALSIYLFMFTQFYLLLLVLIVCMVYGSMMIKDEIENKTLHLLLTSPLTKFEIIMYKYLAYVVGTFLILLIPIVANYVILSSTLGLHEALLNVVVLTNSLFIIFLAVVAYGAIYMLIGNLPRRPVFLGVTYAIFWESFVARIPIFIQYFTINHYLRSVMLPMMEEYVANSQDLLWLTSGLGTSLATPQATALIILTIVPFIFLFMNMLFLKYRDFS